MGLLFGRDLKSVEWRFVRYLSTFALSVSGSVILPRLTQIHFETRSSWLNCALRDDEAVNWVSIGH